MMYLFTLIYDVLVYSQIIHSTNPPEEVIHHTVLTLTLPLTLPHH